ncbi:MAG: pyridoxal phosphate-dependent aminotransferase, partial [Clostridia bacterium]|nr:pyridoxal phosphate-dependent aminotransferase [Clostridia bacterium]
MNYENVLCGRIKNVPPSGIRKFFDIVSEMKDVISLGVGEPDFTTPWRYSDAAIYSLRSGHTHYTSNRGLKELTKLISEYEERFGVHYAPTSEIMVTVGASEGIDLA